MSLPIWDELSSASRLRVVARGSPLLAPSGGPGSPASASAAATTKACGAAAGGDASLPTVRCVLRTDCDYSLPRLEAAFARRPWLRIVDWPAPPRDAATPAAMEAHEARLVEAEEREGGRPDVELCEYEEHDWSRVVAGNLLADAYVVRKGLQRKAQLAKYLNKYKRKHPDSPLAAAVPETIVVNMWDAFGDGAAQKLGLTRKQAVDMCLAEVEEAMDRTAHLGDQEGTTARAAAERWWIVKPSLTNKGAEIAVVENLQHVREAVSGVGRDVMEWVVQRYVARPLLVAGRKFHLRVYVLGAGALRVYVYKRILALFAVSKYADSGVDDSYAHLTNTAHQATGAGFDYDRYVRLMSELPAMLRKQGVVDAEAKIADVYRQVREIVAHTFAAYKGEFSGFMPMANAFELFGLDFLVTEDFQVVLLEVNCRPDVKQTGSRLGTIIDDLMEGTVQLAVDAHPTVAPAARAWQDAGVATDVFLPDASEAEATPCASDGVTREQRDEHEGSTGASALFDLVYAQSSDAAAAPSMKMQ